MIAIDTNILVRIAANDDPAQVAIARGLMHGHTVLIPRAVLLETEWVLHARYKQPCGVLAAFFTALPCRLRQRPDAYLRSGLLQGSTGRG